jgi:hypothetical protein
VKRSFRNPIFQAVILRQAKTELRLYRLRLWGMLELDDPRWGELRHAYGFASDTPGLLRRLESGSTSAGRDEPWFTLWSSLAHQVDVYPASFAAVPHVIRVLASAPTTSDVSFLHFPSWVEICRQRNHVRSDKSRR